MNERDLIENYFNLINTFGEVIILWWIAGVGFCSAILKLTIGHDLIKNKVLNIGLASMVIMFFISLIVFGLFNSYYVSKISQSILAITPLDLIHQSQLDLILNKLNWQFLFPTSTFLLFFIGWLYLIRQKLNQNGDVNDESK